VQPQEPTTGPVPPQPGVFVPAQALGGPPGAVPPAAGTGVGPVGKRPNQRKRLWIAMVGGILALLCLGGAGVVVSLYDNSTKIQRSAPDAVVDNFLRAYLVNRDDKAASLYQCKAGADLAAISALRTEMVDREKNFDVKVSATWSTLTVGGGDPARKTVTTDLNIAGASDGNTVSRRTETWSFGLVDDDGWRVCTASRLS
jgi:hypothetical protein